MTTESCERKTIITADGVELALTRRCRNPDAPAVLLLHGLSISSAMFAGPEWHNLATYLLDHDFGDVWLLDWRSSSLYGKRYLHLQSDMDDIAQYDLPAAIRAMRAAFAQQGGQKDIHLIGHCLGSMALLMGLADGHIDGIKSAICANVGLFPKVSPIALGKLYVTLDFVHQVLGMTHFVVDPADIDFQSSEAVTLAVSHLGSNQCPPPTCRILSFLYGSGHASTVFMHEHLHPGTHARLHEYFGAVPISYFLHLKTMLQHSAVVSGSKRDRVNYLDQSDRISTPLLLCTGAENVLWHDSIQQYHRLLQTYYPQTHAQCLVIPGYSHGDLFMGVHAHRDVFPQLLAFLERHR